MIQSATGSVYRVGQDLNNGTVKRVKQHSRPMCTAGAAAVALIGSAAGPIPAIANNGLNMIGFGTESVGMGGADVAVARDAAALNTNPAGITQLARPAFDGYAAVAFALDVGHADSLGNDQRVDNAVIPAGGFGYTTPIASKITAGIGFFAQGGAGNVYKNLQTPFGTRDELSALIGFAKFTPAVAWQATDDLSLAVSVPVAAITATQRAFPSTSAANPANPAQSFLGVQLKDAMGAGVGVKLGALWRALPGLNLGVTVANKIGLTADGGYANVNFSAAGLGVVRYDEARLDGFALPPEAALGAAWQATARLLLSAEVAWLGWSHALRSTTITLTQPNNPAAPPELSQSATIDARDQWVFALGTAYAATDRLLLYGGVNFGRAPIPSQNLTPLIPPIGETHLTAGFKQALSPDWSLSGALEYLVPRSVSYDNPSSPLGPSTERLSYLALHLMVGRRW
jgi:long-chain fatty acid transport protein